MRAVLLLAVLPLLPACKLLHKAGADAGAEASAASASEAPPPTEAPPASASTAASATAAPAHAAPHFGPPAAGSPCPSKDAMACSADGFEQLTCSGAGTWRVFETCRGPGGCKVEGGAVGAVVKCDPGVPRAGDACVAASAVPRCTDPRSVLQCESGRWVSSLCLPPSKCQPNAKNGQPGCK